MCERWATYAVVRFDRCHPVFSWGGWSRQSQRRLDKTKARARHTAFVFTDYARLEMWQVGAEGAVEMGEVTMFSQQAWPWRRVTGILGIVFFVGVAIGLLLFLPAQPVPDDPIADIREFFADDSALVHTANWILSLIIVFVFLPFAVGLRSVFGEKDADTRMWSRIAYGGAVAIVAVAGAGSALVASAALAVESGGLDDSVLRLILYMDAYIFSVVMSFGIALFLSATSMLVLSTGALWRWLGWFGLAIALLGLIGAWWPLDGDVEGPLAILSFISLPLYAIWSLLAGINLLRTPAAASEATAA